MVKLPFRYVYGCGRLLCVSCLVLEKLDIKHLLELDKLELLPFCFRSLFLSRSTVMATQTDLCQPLITDFWLCIGYSLIYFYVMFVTTEMCAVKTKTCMLSVGVVQGFFVFRCWSRVVSMVLSIEHLGACSRIGDSKMAYLFMFSTDCVCFS